MTLQLLQQLKDWVNNIIEPPEFKQETYIEEAETVGEISDSYIERFESHSLQYQEHLKGREDSIELLEKAYQSWKETCNPLLMVSEAGMGMSSLLHSTTKIYDDSAILEDAINFESRKRLISVLQEAIGIEGDFKSLNALGKNIPDGFNKTIIFENIERLFIRKVNGFNLLDDFILFVHATKSKIYWLLTINRYSYYYLERVKDFSSNFNSILVLKPIDNSYLLEILAQRNEGYSISYLKPKRSNPFANKNLNAEQKQEVLKNDFFKQLSAFSEGNISRALLYWRKSVQRTQDKNIYMRAYQPKPLTDLNLNEILILEAILQHSSLSNSELRQVFRNSSKGSQLSIEKLMEKDTIIYKNYHNSREPEYQINPLYMPAVKQIIKTRLNRKLV